MSIIGNVFSQDNANIFQQNAIRYSSSYFHEDDEFIILGSMEINEIKIEEQRIIFPFNPEWGNSIEFSEGIPDRVWLDGEVILFLKIMKAYENL